MPALMMYYIACLLVAELRRDEYLQAVADDDGMAPAPLLVTIDDMDAMMEGSPDLIGVPVYTDSHGRLFPRLEEVEHK